MKITPNVLKMDIVDSCLKFIHDKMIELNNIIDNKRTYQQDDNEYVQTQTTLDVITSDKDKNLDRILDQQAHLKMIVDKDDRIILLNKQIHKDNLAIDNIRKSCTKLEQNAYQERQELLQTQAKELERFQMQQLKSISDDYRRHQEILEQRKREISSLKKEIEDEEENRESYLASYAKDCERNLQSRKELRDFGTLSSSMSVSNEVRDPNHVELESVQEYAPYGRAPHSRVPEVNSNAVKRGGSTRGRRGRGRGASKGG